MNRIELQCVRGHYMHAGVCTDTDLSGLSRLVQCNRGIRHVILCRKHTTVRKHTLWLHESNWKVSLRK